MRHPLSNPISFFPGRDNLPGSYKKSFLRFFALFSVLLPLATATIGTTVQAQTPNQVPVQFFYVPIPEDQLLLTLQTVLAGQGTAVTNPVQTYISIAAVASNTVIYYDQWENGFEPDISNPTNLYSGANPGGTQIWGDGNPANGAPPGVPGDIINAGMVIVLNNPVTSTNRLAIDFDGGDKIASTKTIAITRTGWGTGPNTLLAAANETFDTDNWGTSFVSPVGEDMPSSFDFRIYDYTGFSIMAGVGGANVQVDADANGSYELNFSLAEGEAYLVNGGVNVGAKILSSKPVQVDILSGDRGETYETRFFGLTPTPLLSSRYYTPVSTPNSAQSVSGTNTVVFLYNPGSSSITINYTTRTGSGGNTLTTTPITVAAGSYAKQVIPDGYGASFISSNGSPFHALSATDANGSSTSTGTNRTWDWGFTLVGEGALTPQLLVGLGIGRDPTSSTNPNENGNPIWVTPLGNGNSPVTVYADFDADPTTGSNTDPNGNKYDISYSLRELDRAKIYDNNDRNQTGTLVYTLAPGIKLAAAWGQDPLTASSSAPGLDVGTGIPPVPLYDAGKNGTLYQDNDGDGFISPGDELLYKIVVNNISRAPVPDITVVDNLPVELNYVPNTTTFKNYNGTITQISDDGFGTAFPLDGSGKVINPSTSLPVGGSYELTFRATIKAFEDLPSGTVNIINTGTANALQSSVNFTSITPIFGRIGDKIWEDQNKNGLQDGSEPGISGVTVNLLNSTGDVVATVTTNPNGEYVFYGVLPGDYSVEFVLPSVYDFTTKNADGQNINGPANSDANPNNGRTDLFTLAGGERNLNIDAGMIPNGSIGDKVWDDLNMNGIQDGSEPGLQNVTVELYTCNDVLVASTTTNANGNYNFAQLAPGSYYVKFITPSGYVFSALNQGGDDNADSDVNPSTGKTDCVNVVLGQDITNIDAGMNVAPSGSIGDYVWNDENGNGVQDNGEDGLEGITVKLYDCDNNPITSTSTAFDGSYSFSSVAAGSYFVKYILPSGYTFTSKDAGIDDNKDSDADPVTGKTSCFTVASGQNITTIDAGMLLNETDIEVLKTTSAATITCGQNYSYTITAKNNGPVDANSIIVNDVLPVGLVFVSATPSQGSYSSVTGDWTVGSLTNGASATITINVSVDCSALNLVNIDLGPAKPYNVFILRDLNQPSADTEGKLAVGGNATLSNYSVGDKLPNSNGAEDVLVVGGNLLYTSGRVYNGNVVYGGTTNLPISAVSIEEGTLRHDNTVIDFADAKTHLENLSTQLSGYASNGATTFQWGTISLINNDPYLNVFTVNGNDLNNANSLEITVPNGSAVIVNILGTNLNWHGGLHVNGTAINNVIFNFPEATLLSISGIDVKGSLLAPFAHLNFPAGIITGQTIVKSMTGSGQFNLSPFLGNIPGNLTIVNVASLTGSDLPDSDHSNNSATAVSTYSPTSTGGGTGSGNWQQIGNFPAGQVVTCLESDGQGNIFAGTASGYIYKRIGNSPDWIHVNQNIYSGAVWALRMHSNGNLYAATVTGVYVGTNNGTAWALGSLQYKDVRTIKMDASGNLYAGTWGFGVYRSLDNGITWTQVNTGIGNNLIITGISVNSNNSLFVGTFGGGVFKSVDQGNNWVPVNMGYNFIWAIASDSDGDVFAGTYGDGLYRSTDNGSSWFKTTFPGTYVYEMRIDGNDNIFATSYSGGVFVSTDKGNTWANIGLGGFGLSSLLIVPNGSTPDAGGEGVIYGGTANGNIYMAVSSVMNIKSGKNTIPTEFSLDQNYPNPFNPSTVIRYSIPFDADVNITVYNTVGQEVTVLAKESAVAGIYSTSFDASNLPSGVYLYRMTAVSSDGKQKFTSTKKMILVK